MKEFLSASAEVFNAWLRHQIEKAIAKLLTKAHPKIKQVLHAPGMYKCVQNLIDDIIDEIWPDIQEEVMYQLK